MDSNAFSKTQLDIIHKIKFDISYDDKLFVAHSYFDTALQIPHIAISGTFYSDLQNQLLMSEYFSKLKEEDRTSFFNIYYTYNTNRYLFGNISFASYFKIDSSLLSFKEHSDFLRVTSLQALAFILLHEISHILDKDYLVLNKLEEEIMRGDANLTIGDITNYKDVEQKCDQFAFDKLYKHSHSKFQALIYVNVFNMLIQNGSLDIAGCTELKVLLLDRLIYLLKYHRYKLQHGATLDSFKIINDGFINSQISTLEVNRDVILEYKDNNDYRKFPDIINKNVPINFVSAYIKKMKYNPKSDFDIILGIYNEFSNIGNRNVAGASLFTIGQLYQHFKYDKNMALEYYDKAYKLNFISDKDFKYYQDKLRK